MNHTGIITPSLILAIVLLAGCGPHCGEIPPSASYESYRIKLTDTSHILSVQFSNAVKNSTIYMTYSTQEAPLYFLADDNITRVIVSHTSGIDTLDVYGQISYAAEMGELNDCGGTDTYVETRALYLKPYYSTFDSTNTWVSNQYSSSINMYFLLKP